MKLLPLLLLPFNVLAQTVYLAPDGTYTSAPPVLAPNGSYTSGNPTLAPNGNYTSSQPTIKESTHESFLFSNQRTQGRSYTDRNKE